MSFDFGMGEFSEALASEERARRSAPPEREVEDCDPDEQEEADADADLFPYDEGYEARVCCHVREMNPYKTADFYASWNLGWDTADKAAKQLSK